MINLINCNEVLLVLIFLSFVLISFIGVICFVLSISYKLKLIHVLPPLVSSTVSVIIFSLLNDALRIRYLDEDVTSFKYSLAFLPIWAIFLMVAFLLMIVLISLLVIIRKRTSSLTAMSIKEAIAILPKGLCFFDETGRLLLTNEQIDKECQELTGEHLYDGIVFYLKMKNGSLSGGNVSSFSPNSIIIEKKNGRVTCYKRILHEMDGRTIYELSSTDITKEFALKKVNEKKNEELKMMNLRLRKYGETVTEVTREKEILATRVKVHGNIGSLILQTKKSLLEEDYDKGELMSKWEDLASLIFAKDEEKDKFEELDSMARNLGIRIEYEGERPHDKENEKIFANAIFECLTNLAKHTSGTELYVKIQKENNMNIIEITNNGEPPKRKIKEGGGLSSLRSIVENSSGYMIIESNPIFKLTIKLSKEEDSNE